MTTDEHDELTRVAAEVRECTEAGLRLIYLGGLRLPNDCTPATLDSLLCLSEHGGYPTRLFFAQQVSAPGKSPNWNGTSHLLGRNWVAFSWNYISAAQRPMQALLGHLDALR